MRKVLFSFCLSLVFQIVIGQGEAGALFQRAAAQLALENTALSLEITETKKGGRTKERAFDLLLASFGDVTKTKMLVKKPKRADGITIVITQSTDETGLIEILTPANGKVRKMKATPRNLELVGSGGFDLSFFSLTPDELMVKSLGKTTYQDKEVAQLEVKEKALETSDKRAVFLIDESTAYIYQITGYNNDSVESSTTFSNFERVENRSSIFPKNIEVTDHSSGDVSTITILKASPKNNLSELDFVLPNKVKD